MSYNHISTHAWCDPLTCFASISPLYPDIAFLYSSLRTSYSGGTSWLAFDALEQFEGEDVALLEHALANAHDTIPTYFGYLAYEFGRPLAPHQKPSFIALPQLRLTRFRHVLAFDHAHKTITHYGNDPLTLNLAALASDTTHDQPYPFESAPPAIASLSSSMSKAYYREQVEATLDEIHAGNFYQANITRKFMGSWKKPLTRGEKTHLFEQLCHISPAPYSAYLGFSDADILSSSPELFLKATDGELVTRPIKGTMPKDAKVGALQASSKNQAENLMIVDLMRNDLSKVAKLGSVHVPELFSVDNFATLQHLSSSITAHLAPDKQLIDVIHALFPAGSMTGAPKHRVMQWCAHAEGVQRGVYSGALGWFAKQRCELSVVIRTLITHGKKFEFQVGGGIVSDSDAHDEWQETMTKARGIAQTLGIHLEELRNI